MDMFSKLEALYQILVPVRIAPDAKEAGMEG
jgi:hypothetical protein